MEEEDEVIFLENYCYLWLVLQRKKIMIIMKKCIYDGEKVGVRRRHQFAESPFPLIFTY